MDIYNKKIKTILSGVLMLLCFVSESHGYKIKFKNNNKQKTPCCYYTIKKGDTLWDLSQKFYKSNWVWPGLWGINGKIKNPHIIYPGEKIKIFLRDVLKKPDNVKHARIITPPAEHKISPTFYFPGMDSLGFIKKRSIKPLGCIIASRDNNVMMSMPDIIYIEQLGHTTMIPGKKYTVFSTKKIKYEYNGKQIRGIKHTIKGVIKIIENNREYLTAKIIRSLHYMTKGDLVMPYKKKASEIKVKYNVKNINAKLICSENKNRLMGDNNIAFINKGNHEHIKKGQIYSIFKELGQKNSPITKKKIILAPLKIGRLIVLHTEKTTSTVLILSARKAVMPGFSVR